MRAIVSIYVIVKVVKMGMPKGKQFSERSEVFLNDTGLISGLLLYKF